MGIKHGEVSGHLKSFIPVKLKHPVGSSQPGSIVGFPMLYTSERIVTAARLMQSTKRCA